ncbi:E3 ubiquitin-protein ligase SDIR1 [Trifolium repens]|nr:E3 ubiquitin-protein ligase SDIR1 [Trifolium repens]
MSFSFRGSRGDIESGFSEYVPERTSTRVHPSRPANNNSLAFLSTVLLIFVIINAPRMLHDFLRWIILAVFVVVTSLRMYATCQLLQEQARARAAAASGLLGQAELRFNVPPSIAIATRGRLQGLRLQLALLDQEFEELDYDTLRALEFGTASNTSSMTDEEINALPIHKYKVPGPTKDGSTGLASSSSEEAAEIKQDSNGAEGSAEGLEDDELTCTICLDQVNRGEIVRSLPCLHQFHANCIDPWLRQQGTCPICKFIVRSTRQGNTESESDDSDIV